MFKVIFKVQQASLILRLPDWKASSRILIVNCIIFRSNTIISIIRAKLGHSTGMKCQNSNETKRRIAFQLECETSSGPLKCAVRLSEIDRTLDSLRFI